MFRIPWKHAGKQDFRKDEDAAIFKVCFGSTVWKGVLSNGKQHFVMSRVLMLVYVSFSKLHARSTTFYLVSRLPLC